MAEVRADDETLEQATAASTKKNVDISGYVTNQYKNLRDGSTTTLYRTPDGNITSNQKVAQSMWNNYENGNHYYVTGAGLVRQTKVIMPDQRGSVSAFSDLDSFIANGYGVLTNGTDLGVVNGQKPVAIPYTPTGTSNNYSSSSGSSSRPITSIPAVSAPTYPTGTPSTAPRPTVINPVTTGSDGTTTVKVSNTEVIAWNVSAMRSVAEKLKSVAANFHDAHERCAVLVPKINDAWDSTLAAEKFEEKLDLGLVRHFMEGHAALTALANLLDQCASVYEECEKRIKNGDYSTVTQGSVSGANYTYSAEGFYTVKQTATQKLGDLGDAIQIDRSKLSTAEQKAIDEYYALGLPVGAYKRVCGGNKTTHYYDANGNELFTMTDDKLNFPAIANPSIELKDADGNIYTRTQINMGALTDAEIENFKKIFKNGVSGDVDFFRFTDSTGKTQLGVRIEGADGNLKWYSVQDGYLDDLAYEMDSSTMAQQIAEQEKRAAARDDANKKFQSDLDAQVEKEKADYKQMAQASGDAKVTEAKNAASKTTTTSTTASYSRPAATSTPVKAATATSAQNIANNYSSAKLVSAVNSSLKSGYVEKGYTQDAMTASGTHYTASASASSSQKTTLYYNSDIDHSDDPTSTATKAFVPNGSGGMNYNTSSDMSDEVWKSMGFTSKESYLSFANRVNGNGGSVVGKEHPNYEWQDKSK